MGGLEDEWVSVAHWDGRGLEDGGDAFGGEFEGVGGESDDVVEWLAGVDNKGVVFARLIESVAHSLGVENLFEATDDDVVAEHIVAGGSAVGGETDVLEANADGVVPDAELTRRCVLAELVVDGALEG